MTRHPQAITVTEPSAILRATGEAGDSLLVDYDSRHVQYLPADVTTPSGELVWSRIRRIHTIAIGEDARVDSTTSTLHRFTVRNVVAHAWVSQADVDALQLPPKPSTNRLVHAFLSDGSEIARYSDAKVWVREWPSGTMIPYWPLKVARAAHLAVGDEPRGSRTLSGRPGGRTFDRLVENFRRERDTDDD